MSNFEAFKELVHQRRSMRVFDESDPIPRETVIKCIELATLAPNSSNLQPWEFHIIDDPTILKRFHSICLNQKAARTASSLIAVVAKPYLWKENSKKLLKTWPTSPVPPIVTKYYAQLVPFAYWQGPLSFFGYIKKVLFWAKGLFNPTPRWPTSNGHLREWASKSAAFAAGYLMLALKAAGYDSCPMEGMDEARAKKELGLKRDDIVTMIIAAGRGTEKGIYVERMRFDKSDWLKIN